jgi:hypothetical protein
MLGKTNAWMRFAGSGASVRLISQGETLDHQLTWERFLVAAQRALQRLPAPILDPACGVPLFHATVPRELRHGGSVCALCDGARPRAVELALAGRLLDDISRLNRDFADPARN